MFRRTTVALSLVALLAGTGTALAQQAQGQTTPAPAHRAPGMDRFKQKLGLTNDQATAIKAAYAKHRDEQRAAWQALHTAQADLRTLALNGGDTAALGAKTAEVQQLLGRTIAIRVAVLQEIGPVLTPEQRAKFVEPFMGGPRHRHGHKPAQS
jgi:Spy/CpxP family protein refolding chaperone